MFKIKRNINIEKICIKCGELKTEFFSKGKGKISKLCKECDRKRISDYRKTKQGLIGTIYQSQKLSSKNRNMELPNYTLKELREWCHKQPKFDKLYLDWVVSGYNKMKVPSIDRLDDYKPYTFDNIQLMNWEENDLKGKSDRLNGVNNKNKRPVVQYTLDDDYVNDFCSIAEASRELKINVSSISSVCLNVRKTAGGYKWKYRE